LAFSVVTPRRVYLVSPRPRFRLSIVIPISCENSSPDQTADPPFDEKLNTQEPAGFANECHIYFRKSHFDCGKLPRPAPEAALCAAKTRFLL
jgi:hypothetical protein